MEKYSESEKIELQSFLQRLSQQPKVVEATADKRASHVPIGEIESLLDECFFGMWKTHSFNYQREFNEVVGSLVLEVKHPITGEWVQRTGAAAIIIMQDSGAKIADFNTTKKPNALDLGFPKLKAECIKNAAISIGNIFGRDLNRKTKAVYEPMFKELPPHEMENILTHISKGKNKNTMLAYASANFLVSEEQKEIIQNYKLLGNGTK